MAAAPEWRKSSYSGDSGTDSCVEVSWRKSSYSGASGNNACVEVAIGADVVGVRDSKNADGPRLAFAAARWRAFVGGAPVTGRG
ncbi:MAG TPA: DUF397 domain-containing protein [Pseudonocardiaceae bacterium]|jgi:hypothetical protein|nr:DUF397 domain-containing protein [Pseudonocardiaceae bacterium]